MQSPIVMNWSFSGKSFLCWVTTAMAPQMDSRCIERPTEVTSGQGKKSVSFAPEPEPETWEQSVQSLYSFLVKSCNSCDLNQLHLHHKVKKYHCCWSLDPLFVNTCICYLPLYIFSGTTALQPPYLLLLLKLCCQ